MKVNSVFGAKLKEVREARQLSQSELAKKLHVSTQTVSNWEISSSNPSLTTFMKIADVLDISPNYLLGYDKEVKLNTDGLDKKIIFDLQIIINDFKSKKRKED